ADLLDQLGPGPLAGRVRQGAASRGPLPASGTAAQVLAALGEGACLDELGRTLALEPPLLTEALLQLELSGLVRPEPGLRWTPC
ncbi:MAG: DNA-processing protein DprA, partial [Cyanobium sp.]